MIFAILAIAAILIAVVVAASTLHKNLSEAGKAAEKTFPKSPVGGVKEPCPLAKQIKLVEFVEVVTRGSEGVVEKPGKASTKLPTVSTRSLVEDGKYPQLINLGKDINGVDKRAPENDRFIELKARVEWASGDKSESLAGKKVHLSFTKTKAANHPPELKGNEKEGFNTPGGPSTVVATAGVDGWTSTIVFHLSQFGGDIFKFEAQADEKDVGRPSGAKLNLEGYQVWRKFWHQNTYAEGFALPSMAVSKTAYKKVFAYMELDQNFEFKPAEVPERTFYPHWMTEGGANDRQVAIVGGHNREFFYGKFDAKATQPPKAHLIVCEYQWDPAATTPIQTFTLTKKVSGELKLKGLKYNNGAVTKPALQGPLVVYGVWKSLAPAGQPDFGKNGFLVSDNVEVKKNRSTRDAYIVSLPADAPDPSVHPVEVSFTLNHARYWGGESNGYQIIIGYSGNQNSYDMCVSHEIGHAVYQTPRNGVQAHKPLSLPDHAKFYTDNRGGQGPHCSWEASVVADPQYPDGRFFNGSCIMFHQLNPTGCKQVFCPTCQPYLQLQEMTALSAKT